MTDWLIGWLHISAIITGCLFAFGASACVVNDREPRCVYGVLVGSVMFMWGAGLL